MKTEKSILYEQVTRIGKAVSSPWRLEILSLLSQANKTVECLANELDIDVKLASAHLKILKEAQLVRAERQGKFMVYRICGSDVAMLPIVLRQVAESHLLELQQTLREMASHAPVTELDRTLLLTQAETGEIVVIDVRPFDEYQHAHLPFARSMPLHELKHRLRELPPDKQIVAYCRGPFCVMANQAVALLAEQGLSVRVLREGVNEWRASGLPIETARKSPSHG